jgi:hypothetical protein
MAEKLCKDCRSVDVGEVCTHPSAIKTCVVTGKPLYHLCKTERGNYINSICRPEGRLFERREIQGSYGGEV